MLSVSFNLAASEPGTAMAAVYRDAFLWLVVIAGLAMVLFYSFLAVHRRRSIWGQFARQHGLRFAWRGAEPFISGEIDGREFRMEALKESSDQGPMGIQNVEMRLRVDTGVPHEFQLTNEGEVVTLLREAVGDVPAQHVSDERFEAHTSLQTDHPHEVEHYLSPRRRLALLQLIEDTPDCDIFLNESALRLRMRSASTTLDELNGPLAAMRAAATQLTADVETIGNS